MSNRAVREEPTRTRVQDIRDTDPPKRDYRVVIRRRDDNTVHWVAQPPHYQHTRDDADTYGKGMLRMVYGDIDFYVEVETRTVGPWTTNDLNVLRSTAFRDAADYASSCVDRDHVVTMLRSLSEALLEPVPAEFMR